MDNKKMKKSVLPLAGATMIAGAAFLMLNRPSKRQKMQKTAGRAIKAVGDAVEHFNGGFKM